MNLHVMKWDEESAHWRTRILQNVDPLEPIVRCRRFGQPWLAWNIKGGEDEFLELESVAALITPDGDVLLYYRPAREYWRDVNLEAACHVEWLEREWPTFGEVALEELNTIAQAVEQEAAANARLTLGA
jgi:hypothetical protein